jgi:hypothetical protein
MPLEMQTKFLRVLEEKELHAHRRHRPGAASTCGSSRPRIRTSRRRCRRDDSGAISLSPAERPVDHACGPCASAARTSRAGEALLGSACSPQRRAPQALVGRSPTHSHALSVARGTCASWRTRMRGSLVLSDRKCSCRRSCRLRFSRVATPRRAPAPSSTSTVSPSGSSITPRTRCECRSCRHSRRRSPGSWWPSAAKRPWQRGSWGSASRRSILACGRSPGVTLPRPSAAAPPGDAEATRLAP